MEEARSKYINFKKIREKPPKNLEASEGRSFFLAYPVEASENSIQRWTTELKNLKIEINKTYPIDGIDEPIVIFKYRKNK